MTNQEIRKLTNEEIIAKIDECKEELFNLRFQLAVGQLENGKALTNARKDIARIYTVLRERELGIK